MNLDLLNQQSSLCDELKSIKQKEDKLLAEILSIIYSDPSTNPTVKASIEDYQNIVNTRCDIAEKIYQISRNMHEELS